MRPGRDMGLQMGLAWQGPWIFWGNSRQEQAEVQTNKTSL